MFKFVLLALIASAAAAPGCLHCHGDLGLSSYGHLGHLSGGHLIAGDHGHYGYGGLSLAHASPLTHSSYSLAHAPLSHASLSLAHAPAIHAAPLAHSIAYAPTITKIAAAPALHYSHAPAIHAAPLAHSISYASPAITKIAPLSTHLNLGHSYSHGYSHGYAHGW